MKNLSKNVLIQELIIYVILLVICLAMIMTSLQKAPYSFDYLRAALICGCLYVLLLSIFYVKKLHWKRWWPVLSPWNFLFIGAPHYYFANDVVNQYKQWLMLQWIAVYLSPIFLIAYIAVISHLQKFKAASKEKPSP